VTGASNDFTLSLSPSTLVLQRGQTGGIQVTATVASGSAENVSLSVSGYPSGVTASFNPVSGTAGSLTSTLTFTASSSANTISGGTVTITGTAPSATHNSTMSLTVADPPTVSVTHPADTDIVTGLVEIDATGAAGAGGVLQKIEILVDGTVIASPTASPAQAFWQSTEVTDGAHLITARAVDADGMSTASPQVHVTVRNSAPPDTGGGGCNTAGAGLSALLGLLVILRRRRVT
jgi:MYXO-CTERM domain-containing protein